MQIRHVDAAGAGEKAAADLRGAFEQVADEDALAEARPVVGAPAEAVHQRRQRRVGDAAGDDDIGAGGKRRQQRIGTEVGVGRDEAVAEIRRTRRAGAVEQRQAGSTARMRASSSGS